MLLSGLLAVSTLAGLGKLFVTVAEGAGWIRIAELHSGVVQGTEGCCLHGEQG